MVKFKLLITACLFLCMHNAFSQEKTITGLVKDVTGSPIPGVSVSILGETRGTNTDFDGKFSLKNVKTTDKLMFSYIGMKEQIILVGDKTTIDVTLLDSQEVLDEIIVVGYGTQKKGLVTGSNVNLKGAVLEELNTASPIEGLQGIAPGVNITRNNGQPGAGTKVTIRGLGTNGNSNPLYIVDGIAVGNIDYLNASDIQSLDVLKDAASAAIYGSRAANGVILVTTVKGRKNTAAKISFNSYYGIQNIYKSATPLNAQEYMYIIDEGFANDGKALNNWEAMVKNNSWLNDNYPGNLGDQLGTEIWNNIQNGGKGTNWFDEITSKNAAITSHTLNITGGGENNVYSLGISYFNQEGLIGNHITNAGFKRLTARLNTEFVLRKNDKHNILTLGQNLTYTNTDNRNVATGNIYYNDLHNALVQNPLMPAYWQPSIDNNVNEYGFTPTLNGIADNQHNPLGVLFYRHNFNNLGNQNNKIVGNVYTELEPIKNLKFKSVFGFDSWFGHSRSYSPVFALGLKYLNTKDAVSQSQYQGTNITFTNTASYKHSFGNHTIDGLLGVEVFKNKLNVNVSGRKSGSIFGDPEFAYLDNFGTIDNLSNISTNGKDAFAGGGGLLSYFGRAQYNYKEKYLFTAIMRADGSSNFSKNNRWGYFPSFSAGWVISDEEFMSTTSSFLDYAKVRASWGQNGNQSVNNFIYSSTIEYSEDIGYYFGDSKPVSVDAAFPARVPNPDIKWETSEQLNFGIDTRLFDSKLGLSLDWYKKTTKDWLVQAQVLGTAGAEAPIINGGDIENSGVEFVLNWDDNIGNVKYGATISGAFNKNKITRIANADGVFNGLSNVLSQGTASISRASVGLPIGYFYGFKADGILQNQDEVDAYVTPNGDPYFADQRPGDVRFVDQNQDGVIDDKDKVMLGNPHPDFELGVQLNAEYKGFYANVTMAGKFGMQVMKSYRSFVDRIYENYTTEIFGRWHGEGTSNKIPRLGASAHRNTSFVSDIFMHNADYLRINNLTIGVNLDQYLKNVNFASKIKIYASVNNLYTFTNYNGMDPEVGYGGGTNWASGVDLGLYPLPRTVIFGLNLDF
ncbi:TonB-dependent receptor [Polaribacter batillariae]|uniref:TonB-dependent receptor n=1 Tax=Polaribacter batillariae TaxID=2808900 RepID=A0ABX7SW73_9FLAO|nr:TonB-dependent receptor [Polaribacter batillariae]QTD38497.1 TonB-dependent receptor [Polaribacter batillariae]